MFALLSLIFPSLTIPLFYQSGAFLWRTVVILWRMTNFNHSSLYWYLLSQISHKAAKKLYAPVTKLSWEWCLWWREADESSSKRYAPLLVL